MADREFSARMAASVLCRKVVRPVFVSTRTRRYAVAGLLGFLVLTIVILAINPLEHGLSGHYYDNPSWEGEPIHVFQDRVLALDALREQFSLSSEHYSISWTGVIFIPKSGEYFFTTTSDDGSELFIDGQRVVDNSGLHGVVEQAGSLLLGKGVHAISLRYMQGSRGGVFFCVMGAAGKTATTFVDGIPVS